MSLLIRNATIIAMDADHGSEPFSGDIHIEDDRIKAIGPSLDAAAVDRVIDGRDKLVTPGFVNGHIHTPEALFKGRYDNMPLEIWMTYAYLILGKDELSERAIYLRSMVCAIDCLKNGVTFLADDILEPPLQTMATLGAVFQAYDDAGLRANVSGHVINRPLPETIPYLNDLLPADLKAEAAAQAPPSTADYLDFCNEAFARFHDRSGRLRFMIAPSGPQRCTEDLMHAADELARAHASPFHTHILETKVQAVAGREFYGKTLIRYMHDLGLLHRGITIAHGVWVTDEDIELMGDAKCSVVHNALSNQKLGSGIAPIRRMLNAGVNIALGSDGVSTSDTPRMFDVMRAAGLMHNVSSPDSSFWLTADEILRAATIGGAYSALLEDEIGSLEPGKKADLVILDTKNANFIPQNDLRNHLVYCENGRSVETVIVNGEIVVEDGRMTRIDEDEALDELRDMVPSLLAEHAKLEEKNRAFVPHLAEVHRRCAAQDLGINRLGSDNTPTWPSNL